MHIARALLLLRTYEYTHVAIVLKPYADHMLRQSGATNKIRHKEIDGAAYSEFNKVETTYFESI